MWDSFFKHFFGLPYREENRRREPNFDEKPPENQYRNPIWDLDDAEGDDGSEIESLFGNRSFNVLTDPIKMHQFFQSQMEEIFKHAFDFGHIGDVHRIPWNGDENKATREEERSLRDQFLKPGVSAQLTEDGDLDGKVTSRDIQKFLDQSEKPQPSQPTFFSKIVTVQSVRRPDGSVETVRTERDSSGKEVTTTTVTEAPPSAQGVITPHASQDFRGEDIFSKFFNR